MYSEKLSGSSSSSNHFPYFIYLYKDVPYFCQWESRDLAKAILEKTITTDDDPKWKTKGGHLVLFLGYDKGKQEFYIHNPSGTSKETQEYAPVKFRDFTLFSVAAV